MWTNDIAHLVVVDVDTPGTAPGPGRPVVLVERIPALVWPGRLRVEVCLGVVRRSGGRDAGQAEGTTAPVGVTAAVQTEVAAGGDVAAQTGHQ